MYIHRLVVDSCWGGCECWLSCVLVSVSIIKLGRFGMIRIASVEDFLGKLVAPAARRLTRLVSTDPFYQLLVDRLPRKAWDSPSAVLKLALNPDGQAPNGAHVAW